MDPDLDLVVSVRKMTWFFKAMVQSTENNVPVNMHEENSSKLINQMRFPIQKCIPSVLHKINSMQFDFLETEIYTLEPRYSTVFRVQVGL